LPARGPAPARHGDAEPGEDGDQHRAAGRGEQERDADRERHHRAAAEHSMARHVGLRSDQKGADQHEQEAEREHEIFLLPMLLQVCARGNVIMHGRNAAP